MSTDYRGSDFTGALTLANIDLVNDSGVAVTQYLQKVSSRTSLGCELLYQYGAQVPGGQIALYTLAGRYAGMLENYCYCYYH